MKKLLRRNKLRKITRYPLPCLALLFCLFFQNKVSAQTSPDTAAKGNSTGAPAALPLGPSQKSLPEKSRSFVTLEFVKEKSKHSPDSAFFNVLKILNTGATAVQGTIRISAPDGWKIISQPETALSIQPGSTEYVPVRVSLSRNAIGGANYIINATFSSDRPLFPDRNQTSISKACYVAIPEKIQWDVNPLARTVYFNRYAEYTPMQVRLTNKGNGNTIIKLDLTIGNALILYGSMGKRLFTSVELKPHSDSILTWFVKYIPPDESVYWSRDIRNLTVRINAQSDTLVKKSSVNFKYLESSYRNPLASQAYPLNIEVQLQNILSDYYPRLFWGADGSLYFKNNDMLDYYARFLVNPFVPYPNTGLLARDIFWTYSHYRVHYEASNWDVLAGDIGGTTASMIGIGGRGLSGGYRINNKNRISGSFVTAINRSVYSGSIQHDLVLSRKIALSSALSCIVNDYNKMNTYGASARISYSFLPGHHLSLLVAGTQTQHLYSNQTFTNPNGTFITTTNPNAVFYGIGTQLNYNMHVKKATANLTARYTSRHFSQYFNGQLQITGTGQYTINDKYFLLGNVNLNRQDPQLYNKGILYPQNSFTFGRYTAELGDCVNSHLTLYSGPVFDHSEHTQLKIRFNGDSVHTRFSAISPKWSFRLHAKTSNYSSLNVYTTMGYTQIIHAEDSTLGPLPANFQRPFFSTNTGINLIQKNWGINISYFTGPYNIAMQSYYYYNGNYSKTLRIMPYVQRYFYNKRILFTSYNSYYYQTQGNMETMALNARLSFFFNRGWTFFNDNNLYANSRISSEGIRIFSRTYGMNIGFRKSFDLPQPGVKYQDLRIVCFRDINGNGIMDGNEHGLSDIVIVVDRVTVMDSATGKPLRMPGQFAPMEMVTDNFGQVMYYKIPQGKFTISVYPMTNLVDIFNRKGQKQTFFVYNDTTYYIPFVQSFRVLGHVVLKRDEFSALGSLSVANIRITATDTMGNSYSTLTTNDGSYTLYVPEAGEYKVTMNNVFGDQFTMQDNEYTVSFDGTKEYMADFIFNEKKRKINIAGAGTATPAATPPAAVPGAPAPANPAQTGYAITGADSVIKSLPQVTDTINSPKTANIEDAGATEVQGQPQRFAYSLPVGTGITYKIQLVSSPKRIPAAQLKAKFPGVQGITEYSEGGMYKYVVGSYATIPEAQKAKQALHAKGYKDAFMVPFSNGKRVKY